MNTQPWLGSAVALLKRRWRSLLLAFLLYSLPMIAFVSIADEILEQEPLPGDTAVLQAVHALDSQVLNSVVPIVTNLGGMAGVVILTLLAIVLLVMRRRIRDAITVGAGVGGAALLNLILKSIFQRDRPQLWERIVTENSFSFPSGHAMASSALALSIVLICWRTRYRWWAVAGAGIYMVVIGFTRLYLGVHYPSDIVAGWSASAVWVLLVGQVIMRWGRK
jgi:membrane-associated phospholipid phosphatase